MNRQAMQKLRLDRRLTARKNWMSRDELDRELEALPDVSHKGTTLGEAAEANSQPPEATRSPE
jgi:hypothetical protein